MLQCSGQQFKRLVQAGLTWLETNHQTVNALNVFPIPDGDTGTNMLLTMQAAYKEIADSPDVNVGKMAHAVAHGALMGARGNSGVILSQIWRGFARALDNLDVFAAEQFCQALQEASDTAYRGVGRPVEGTILTVIKDTAAGVAHAAQPDLRLLLQMAVEAAHASVARTPELLPVLKQAGVVDSGGKGLAYLFEGMLRHLLDQPLDQAEAPVPVALDQIALGAAMEKIEPGQEWEVVVDFRLRQPMENTALYARLEPMGTSIQIGEGDGLYRVHIHLLKTRRYEPIMLAEELGTVVNVHMENLLDQVGPNTVEPLPLAQVQNGQIGIIAVSPGQGLSRILASLGVAAIVSGGQTMNPSTQEIVEAVNQLPTDQVIILPNNKNIVLAARQAAELVHTKRVVVVPARTVPQGIAAMLNAAPDGDLDEVAAAMQSALAEIESGEVTTATRSVELDGVAVHAGQVIGLHNGALKIAGDNITDTVLRLLTEMGAAQRELITLYAGATVTAAEAETLVEAIRAAFPDQTVELHEGDQPHYHYILSAE